MDTTARASRRMPPRHFAEKVAGPGARYVPNPENGLPMLVDASGRRIKANEVGREERKPLPRKSAARARSAKPALDLTPIPLAEVERSAAEPLVLGRLDGNDNTVLFGDGGTGKGVIAASWAARLSKLGDVILVLDYEGHTRYEWRPRVEDFGGVMSNVYVLQPAPHPIWDIAEQLALEVRALSERHGGARVWVFVDSVTYACVGEEVEKSSTAARYWSAIAQLGHGVPTLSLAHVTKSDADPRHPFGSVQWSNGARVTIGVSRKDASQDTSPRVLRNRKTNQRAPFPPVEIDWSWAGGEGGVPSELDESGDTGSGSAASDRLYDAMLGLQWLTVREAVALANQDGLGEISTETARKAMERDRRFAKESAASGAGGRGRAARWMALPRMKKPVPTSEPGEGA